MVRTEGTVAQGIAVEALCFILNVFYNQCTVDCLLCTLLKSHFMCFDHVVCFLDWLYTFELHFVYFGHMVCLVNYLYIFELYFVCFSHGYVSWAGHLTVINKFFFFFFFN